ncbi:MAG TPA: biotin--[acetyl-CoA-carboxylase] ligase [Gammaproteobacteria bacterium]|nr:biotin--[acetyl-CoA-carboxylase] ligase [Gammaproteobacteria bacterium]
MSASFDFLNEEFIRTELDPDVARQIARLEIHDEIDSTNQALLDGDIPVEGKLAVCLAEYQRAGRGRRGRSWIAPFGRGLCLSAGWLFDRQPADLTALALAAGVVIRRALHETAGVALQLKWPNDLVFDDKKLGGVLVELRVGNQGSCLVVIGVGVNVSISSAELEQISGWSDGAIDLFTATGGCLPSRNKLAAKLIVGISRLLSRYGDSGFSAYCSEFKEADYLRGRQISVNDASRGVCGVAAGIDAAGALLVDTGGAIERIIGGDVSVRTIA